MAKRFIRTKDWWNDMDMIASDCLNEIESYLQEIPSKKVIFLDDFPDNGRIVAVYIDGEDGEEEVYVSVDNDGQSISEKPLREMYNEIILSVADRLNKCTE